MRNECAVVLSEAFEKALSGHSPETIAKARKSFIKHFRGTNVYVSMNDPLKRIRRNMDIISVLPSFGRACSKSRVHELARKYDLSLSQIYRIRRDAPNTYMQLEELYDHGLMTEEQHQSYLAILKEKLPPHILGKPLA
ncbi:MAG: Mor transcription activator family protein [Spirochaetota bacterium]